MFIWLSSYPKSGNTFVRSLLSSYFFSEDGNFDFSMLKNILQFPNKRIFENLGINLKDEKEVVRNYLVAQKTINKKGVVQFLKTHSYLFDIENNPFTSLDYSLGVIYIVRDPRNVVTSMANNLQITNENALKRIANTHILEKVDNGITIYSGTWASHFNSWKPFKEKNRYLLIKYEDLIKDTEKALYGILEFIYKLDKKNFIIDKKKFSNVIKTTTFKNLQKLENENGFDEILIKGDNGEKPKFFHKGPENDWRKRLEPDLQKKIELIFQKEMIELKYL